MTASPFIHRIGAISRLAGVPVSTLRVWEQRYQAFSPVKTEGQHRLYDEDDLAKATLLRQLSEDGHAIGTIAALALPALRELQRRHHHAQALGAPQAPALAPGLLLVGAGLASRMASAAFTQGLQRRALRVQQLYADMHAALAHPAGDAPLVVLVKTNTLHEGLVSQIQAMAATHAVLRVVVVYHFGRAQVAQVMQDAGIVVRREPVGDDELAELLSVTESAPAATPSAPQAAAAPRKYSDETLSRVASISTHVACECPRHIAEILAQLSSFEQYSKDCIHLSARDAHLHAHLGAVAGAARGLFEGALEMVARHEGIALEPGH